MDKISLLQERKAKIEAAGKDVRAQIAALTDESSFVELSAFSFSKSDFYNEEAEGEGGGQTDQPMSQTELIQKAAEALDKAQEAQQNGDWAGYGKYLDELEKYLDELAS